MMPSVHSREEAFPVSERDECTGGRSSLTADKKGAPAPPTHEQGVSTEWSIAPSMFRMFQDPNLVAALTSNLGAVRLHVLPSLFFGAAVCAIFALLSAFLEYYVADSRSAHFGLFVAGSCAPTLCARSRPRTQPCRHGSTPPS
jgi:hypothetical protein